MPTNRGFFIAPSLAIVALGLYFLALQTCGGVVFDGALIRPTDYCPECCVGTYGIESHGGYEAPFAGSQHVGAKFANGTRVVREWQAVTPWSDPVAVAAGEQGTVLGSIFIPKMGGVGYFVAWDSFPKRPVLTVETKFTAMP